jgi:hypothetical protein
MDIKGIQSKLRVKKFKRTFILGPIILALLYIGWIDLSWIEAGINRLVYGPSVPVDKWIYLKGHPLLSHRWPRFDYVKIMDFDLHSCLWVLYWVPPNYGGPIHSPGEWIDESMNLACSCDDGNTWKAASRMPDELNAYEGQNYVGADIAYKSEGTKVFSRSSATAGWLTINPQLDDIPITLPNRMKFLAVDPQDKMQVYTIWSGLGYPTGAWEKTDIALYKPGLCLSNDGGKHFTRLLPFYWKADRDFNFKTLAVDPNNTDHLLAQFAEGIISSNDKGGSWIRVEDYDKIAISATPWLSSASLNTQISKIVFDRYRAGHVFAASNKGLLFSIDRGHHWQIVNMGFSSFDPRITISAHPKKDLIYVASEHGLFKTHDGGASWDKMHTPYAPSFWRRVFHAPYFR